LSCKDNFDCQVTIIVLAFCVEKSAQRKPDGGVGGYRVEK